MELTGATLLVIDALAARDEGDWTRVAELATEAERVAEVADAPRDLGAALMLSGEAAMHLALPVEARRQTALAERVGIELDDPMLRGAALVQLVRLDGSSGDLVAAQRRTAEAFDVYLRAGELFGTLPVSVASAEILRSLEPAWARFPTAADLDRRFPGLAEPAPVNGAVNLGIPFIPSNLPYHGVRIQAGPDHSGWILWSGDEAETPYLRVSSEVIEDVCPEVLPYLRLGVGMRFLIAPDHEDVWFDDLAARDTIGE